VSRPLFRALLLTLVFQVAVGSAVECAASCAEEDGTRDCATVCCRAVSPLVVTASSATAILDCDRGSVPDGQTVSVSAVFAREILHIPKPILT
jgi:hypothetical protein